MAGASAAFGFPRLADAAMDPAVPGGVPFAEGKSLFEPTLWFAIDGDGQVTVNIIRAEMGQHVGTAIARILADELEVNWDKVRIVHVDTDPKWGLMVTGGSWSVWQSWPVYQPSRRRRTHGADRRGREVTRRSADRVHGAWRRRHSGSADDLRTATLSSRAVSLAATRQTNWPSCR